MEIKEPKPTKSQITLLARIKSEGGVFIDHKEGREDQAYFPDGKPLGGVAVVLLNDLSGHRQEARTGADGAYLLYNVPPNPYHLTIEAQGFKPFHADLDVRGTAPVVKDVTLTFGGEAPPKIVEPKTSW